MPSWPREIEPQQSSPFVMPGALQSWSQTGKGQHRATAQAGRIWSETYPPFKAGSIGGRKLIAFINNMWRNGTQFDIEHYSYLTPNGGGVGTVTVNGASQTGSVLNVTGWGGGSVAPYLRAGDIIRVAGLSPVYDITADSTTALAINPPIFAGGSPASGAVVTYTGVRLNAFILNQPDMPNAGPNGFIVGLSVTFREAV